jgi:hypothetical protein
MRGKARKSRDTYVEHLPYVIIYLTHLAMAHFLTCSQLDIPSALFGD